MFISSHPNVRHRLDTYSIKGIHVFGVLVPTKTISTAAYAAVIPRTSRHVPLDTPARTTATRNIDTEAVIKLFITEARMAMISIGTMNANPPKIAPPTLP
jgi:hypothetical protein